MGTGTHTVLYIDGESTSDSVNGKAWVFAGTKLSDYNYLFRDGIPKYAIISSAICSLEIKRDGSILTDSSLYNHDAQWLIGDTNNNIIEVLSTEERAISRSFNTFSRDCTSYIQSGNVNSGLATTIGSFVFQASGDIKRKYTVRQSKIVFNFTYPTITINGLVNNNDYGEVISSTHTLGSPIDIGTVTNWGTQTCTLEARPKPGYKFVCWHDGSTNSVRSIELSEDKLYSSTTVFDFEATFERITHTVSTGTDPSEGGSVSGGGTYTLGTSVTLKATPKSNYRFERWSKIVNGAFVESFYDPSITFTLSEDVTYIAHFSLIYVTFDSIFNFQRWKDKGITSDPSKGIINNLTDIGFVFQSSTGDGYTNQSPTFKVTKGKQYTLACDILGKDYQIYIFHCPTPDPGSWTSQPSGQQFNVLSNQNTLTFTALADYISIRCDADGNGNAVSFSNFRVYPKDFNYFSTTVTPEYRSDKTLWENINKLPRREWHTFDGWYTDPIDGTLYNASSAFPTDDLTLYSQWTGTIPRTFLVQTNERQVLYKNGAFLPGKTVHFKWKEQ